MRVLQFLKYILIGGILPFFGLFRLVGKMKFVEKYFSELFRRTYIELLTGKFVNLFLQITDVIRH